MSKQAQDSAERIARAAIYDMLEAGAAPADVLIMVQEAMEAFYDAGGHSEGELRRLRGTLRALDAMLDGDR